MLFLLTALPLVVAATLGTTTADEEIPWINEVPNGIKDIPFDEHSFAVELKVSSSWATFIAANKYMYYNINLLGIDRTVKVGFGIKNTGGVPTWGLNPCTKINEIPLPENFVYSAEADSIWTIWKDDGKLNILYNGEDFLRDAYPGVTEGLDCLNATPYPNGKEQWEPDWEAEIKSVQFYGFISEENEEKLAGYRFIPIPVDAESGKNKYF